MRLQRLISTRLASSGRDTTDMTEAGQIVFCWHFCWHSRVEDFQILATRAVRFGGGGRNRLSIPAVARQICLILLGGVQPQSSRTPIESGVFATLSSTRQNFVRTNERSKGTLRLPVHWHFHWHFSRRKTGRQSSIGEICRHHRCNPVDIRRCGFVVFTRLYPRLWLLRATSRRQAKMVPDCLRLPSLSC